MDTVQSYGMEQIMGQLKRTTANHIKGQSLSEEGNVVYMVGLKGSLQWPVPSRKSNKEFQQVVLLIRPTESNSDEKCPELVKKNV